VYDLRMHIDLVRQRLRLRPSMPMAAQQRAAPTASVGPCTARWGACRACGSSRWS
jgi:hypothetical protein